MNLFVSGIVTGFSVAAPIGPVSLLCINHTLARGTLYGFTTALGATTADTFYGLIAALGLTAVSVFSMQHQAAIRLAGAVLIILIGLYQFLLTYRAGAPDRDHQAPGVAKGFALVFTSTLSNPFTVCFFLSVFSAFSGTGAAAHTYRRAFAYAGGVGVGTAAWWLILTVCTGLFSRMLSAPVLAVIRKLAALLIVGIGIYALVR